MTTTISFAHTVVEVPTGFSPPSPDSHPRGDHSAGIATVNMSRLSPTVAPRSTPSVNGSS